MHISDACGANASFATNFCRAEKRHLVRAHLVIHSAPGLGPSWTDIARGHLEISTPALAWADDGQQQAARTRRKENCIPFSACVVMF